MNGGSYKIIGFGARKQQVLGVASDLRRPHSLGQTGKPHHRILPAAGRRYLALAITARTGDVMSLAATGAEPPTEQLGQFRAELHLGPYPSAPMCARSWARAILAEWHLSDLAGAAEPIVSEIVTKAILISGSLRSPVPITIRLISGRSGRARARAAEAADESGRGPMIIEVLGQESGWYRPRSAPTGEVVWCLLEAFCPRFAVR